MRFSLKDLFVSVTLATLGLGFLMMSPAVPYWPYKEPGSGLVVLSGALFGASIGQFFKMAEGGAALGILMMLGIWAIFGSVNL